MKYLIISNALVIHVDGKTFIIEPSDQRHEALMKEFQAVEINEEKVKDILYFRLSAKIKQAEIKDGQFFINGQLVPEPFLSFFMKEKSDIPRFEFFYNLYYSLNKSKRTQELEIFKHLIHSGVKINFFSPKEETCLIQSWNYQLLPKDSIFKVVREPITEEMMSGFIKKYFKKNIIKAFKNYLFNGNNNLSWTGITENLSFILNFEVNDDKFFDLVDQMQKEGVEFNSNYHFMNPANQNLLVRKLKALGVESVSDLKRFFGGWTDFWHKVNQLHVVLEETMLYETFYNNEVYFNNLSKLTFTQYLSVLNPKLKEWREKHESKAWAYFNLPERHPWLLTLEPMQHEELGQVEFAFPYRGIELDMWSNTMNNCIRSYKKRQALSSSMILLNLNCPVHKTMIATLELEVFYRHGLSEPQLKVVQFVGQANSHMRYVDSDLYEVAYKQLYEKFDTYVKKHAQTGAYARAPKS